MDTAGDGFFATFDGPARAVRCALAAVEAVRPLGIEIRAGVHTGEVETIDAKAGGMAVIIGARISASAGAPRFALLDREDLVAGSGLAFADVGEHELKGAPSRPSTEWWGSSIADGTEPSQVGSERGCSVPLRDPALRPIGVARQIDRDIHATVDVTPGRGEEPAHPTPGRAASATGRRTWNESSEDQPPIGIERRDLTEGPDRTIFLVHRDDDTAAVGWVRKEHEHDGDPHRRATRLGVVRSARGERNRHEDERHPAPPATLPALNVASTPTCAAPCEAQRGIALQEAQVLGNATTRSML